MVGEAFIHPASDPKESSGWDSASDKDRWTGDFASSKSTTPDTAGLWVRRGGEGAPGAGDGGPARRGRFCRGGISKTKNKNKNRAEDDEDGVFGHGVIFLMISLYPYRYIRANASENRRY